MLLFSEMKFLVSSRGRIPAARTGDIGTIFALIVILIVLTFGFGFPILYFLFGKKFSVSKGLQFLIGDH
ncbi:hypothetical protein LBHB_05415 [Leptospira borgpetersenii serovar Hardjo]|nr:hypothetical protein LBHB_05415 [Leptospira borgpetersenii serovar Hardjo]